MLENKIEREKMFEKLPPQLVRIFFVWLCCRVPGEESNRSGIPLTLKDLHSQEAVGCLALVLHQPQRHPSEQCPGSFKEGCVSSFKTSNQVFDPVPHKQFLWKVLLGSGRVPKRKVHRNLPTTLPKY